jgi:hypothetical protein
MDTLLKANPIFGRFTHVVSDMNDPRAWLRAQRDGERLLLLTGARSLRRSRMLARSAGLAGILAGLAFVTVSPWGWMLAALGVLTFFVLPSFVRAVTLLEVDGARELVVVAQRAAGPGALVPIGQIIEIRGVYETQGWDSRSAVYAVLRSGIDAPLLIFSGTDEPLAEYACRTIGALLDRPATYAGPFGGVKTCYAPEATGAAV